MDAPEDRAVAWPSDKYPEEVALERLHPAGQRFSWRTVNKRGGANLWNIRVEAL